MHTCFSTSVRIHECIHSRAKLTMNVCKRVSSLENFAYVELMNLCEYIFQMCFATFESSATLICPHNELKLPKADYILAVTNLQYGLTSLLLSLIKTQILNRDPNNRFVHYNRKCFRLSALFRALCLCFIIRSILVAY